MRRRDRSDLAILIGARLVASACATGHSNQAVPETIEEVRRILREQVARR